MSQLTSVFIQDLVASYFKEDDFQNNLAYIRALPKDLVECSLKFKQDIVVAGMPFFVETFKYLGAGEDLEALLSSEGKSLKNGAQLGFELPFNVALTGERIALNLLQRASSIATYTRRFVDQAKTKNIKVLDTRKTTPGHRALEKYAVRTGGGNNHRFGQTDVWMVKDNHKSFFGGLEKALAFFEQVGTFYNSVVVEIHDLEELRQASELGVRHLMLDNFSPDEIRRAVDIKKAGQTFEVSGGISLENLENYLIAGVDAVSSGSLTYNAPHVDISLKYQRKER